MQALTASAFSLPLLIVNCWYPPLHISSDILDFSGYVCFSFSFQLKRGTITKRESFKNDLPSHVAPCAVEVRKRGVLNKVNTGQVN